MLWPNKKPRWSGDVDGCRLSRSGFLYRYFYVHPYLGKSPHLMTNMFPLPIPQHICSWAQNPDVLRRKLWKSAPCPIEEKIDPSFPKARQSQSDTQSDSEAIPNTLLAMKCSWSHPAPLGFLLVEFQLWTRKKRSPDVRHTWPALSKNP